MRRLLSIIALALPLAAPIAAHAQTTQPQPPASSWQQKFIAKFNAANTTHDGHLTLAQAQAAGLTRIVQNFTQIDTGNKGYVTLDDLQAWHKAHHHQNGQQPAS
jgi:hypothetical protein